MDEIILTERQLAILRAIVEEYVDSAQPVSSSAIADRPNINTSSATVRNEMARLEEMGLLIHPYTSAGRIPTDLGYRYYVNYVLSRYRSERDNTTIYPQVQDPGIEATCRLLGELTRYTALAIVPGWQEHRLQHLELALVGEDQLLIVLVTGDRQVLHSLTTVPDRPSHARIRQLNDLLNQEFSGKLLAELTTDALFTAVNRLPHVPTEFYRQAPELLRRGLEREGAATRVYVDGASHLFEQKDFANMPKLRALMEALQEEDVFERLFARANPGEVQVSIGAENPHAGLEDCAIVFTSYHISEYATGRVGVLGPKRMPYRRIIQTIDAVVSNLDERLK